MGASIAERGFNDLAADWFETLVALAALGFRFTLFLTLASLTNRR
jgi:hypothetical protein